MKRILAMLLVLMVLVGCTTSNNNNNGTGGNNNNGNTETVVKVVYLGVIYEATDEVSESLGSSWSYSGTVKEVVADADINTEYDVIVSNSLEVGTEVFAETGNEETIVVATGDSEYTTFGAAK
ncbi:MAG: hypothetical protein GX775_07130 [Erysipelothrix sp.]|nr:hypothetical protein [Erysipelothrix sp.]